MTGIIRHADGRFDIMREHEQGLGDRGVHDGGDLAIIIPLWRRTKHIERVLNSALVATPDAHVVFVVSRDDHAVVSIVDDIAVDQVAYVFADGAGGQMGDYAKKINAGYRATTEPFLFTGADDLEFHAGWYDAARSLVHEADPVAGLPPIGVVGTNDLTNPRTMRGEHSTHSLVARWYADCCAVVDHPRAIYAECYGHEYCDDELVGYAESKGAYAHALDAIVEHLHPLAHKSEDDDTYRRGRAFSRMSRRKFGERRRRWTPA